MMMSEKEKEKEKEEEREREEVILDHFHHRHPLSLTVAGSRSGRCYGCPRIIYPEETAYTCRDVECGSSDVILHEECAEMPREITLSMHPQHTLIQEEKWHIPTCVLCKEYIVRIGYYCTSWDTCKFGVHVGCAQNIEVVKTCIDHPSHPQHQLMLLKSCSFRCDACGITKKGNSYICSDCQYWIHEICADLPAQATFQHHDHPLSLIYYLPLEYFKFKCHICSKDLLPKYWAYHCSICRYVVHINCAINVSGIINANAAEVDELIGFPTNNAVVEEMIASFVTKLVTANNSNEIQYKFPFHDHELHLISPALQLQLHDEEEVVNDEGEDEDDDDDLSYGKNSELVCDGCTMPINSEKKYMSCGECKYFLHLHCSQLPPHLPSHPLHPKPNHDLILQTTPRSKLDFAICDICGFPTNGLFYKCTKCSDLILDIKCASLPDTIKHQVHPYHHLKLLDKYTTRNWQRLCAACGGNINNWYAYICDRSCQIFLHARCAMLPASVTNPTWDKHPLPLTFHFTGDFYCDVCEQHIDPKSWMYHCRDCDVSIRLHPATTGTSSSGSDISSAEFTTTRWRINFYPLQNQGATCAVKGRNMVPLDFNATLTNATSSCVLTPAVIIVEKPCRPLIERRSPPTDRREAMQPFSLYIVFRFQYFFFLDVFTL